jgi:hypothetical protein
MRWQRSHRFDPLALPLADRHYSRRRPGSPQFVRPARNVVLLTPARDALWVSVFHRPEFCDHAWPGAWECALFRNERPRTERDPLGHLSSELVTEAVAATRWLWSDLWPVPPSLGMITTVDPGKVRHKRDPGRCFIRAGFTRVGMTKSGKVVLQLGAADMPTPCAPIGHLALGAA